MKYAVFFLALLAMPPLGVALSFNRRWMKYAVWAMIGALAVYQNTAINFFSYEDYPLFEGAMTDKEAAVSASFSFTPVLADAPAAPEKTYKNPVTAGADPEIFFEDGVYYLYTFGGGNVSYQTSTDLCTWSEKTVCCFPSLSSMT